MRCLQLLASCALGSRDRGGVRGVQPNSVGTGHQGLFLYNRQQVYGFGAWFVPSSWAVSVCLVKLLQNLCLTAVSGLCGFSTRPREWAAVWSQQPLTRLVWYPWCWGLRACRIQVNRNISKQWYPLQAGTKTGFYPLCSKFEAFCRPGLCEFYHPDSGKSRAIVCQHTPAPLRKGFGDRAGIGKLCLSCHLSQEGLGRMGIASGNK